MPDAVFAFWSRTAAMTGKIGKMETLVSSWEACDYKWSVVHGQSLPAATEGWVQLQFYARQLCIPEKQGQVCALFLLPAWNFSPSHLDDNKLCPKCIHRNTLLMRSLQWDYNAKKKSTAILVINGRKVTTINSMVPLTAKLQAIWHPWCSLITGPTDRWGADVTLRFPTVPAALSAVIQIVML